MTEALAQYIAHKSKTSVTLRPDAPGIALSAKSPETPSPTASVETWSEYRTPGQSKLFRARGTRQDGFTLDQSGNPRIDGSFIETALNHFAGQTVVGGFNMTNPPAGGFGEWVDRNSGRLNSRKLGPRHACSFAGILTEEAGVKAFLDGPHDRVMLTFPPL